MGEKLAQDLPRLGHVAGQESLRVLESVAEVGSEPRHVEVRDLSAPIERGEGLLERRPP